MLGKGEKRLVAAYSAAHFAVDLCCAMLVLPAARAASDKAMALLIYNFCSPPSYAGWATRPSI